MEKKRTRQEAAVEESRRCRLTMELKSPVGAAVFHTTIFKEMRKSPRGSLSCSTHVLNPHSSSCLYFFCSVCQASCFIHGPRRTGVCVCACELKMCCSEGMAWMCTSLCFCWGSERSCHWNRGKMSCAAFGVFFCWGGGSCTWDWCSCVGLAVCERRALWLSFYMHCVYTGTKSCVLPSCLFCVCVCV